MKNKYQLYKCTFTGTVLAENDEKAKESFFKCLKEILPNANNLNEIDEYIIVKKVKKMN